MRHARRRIKLIRETPTPMNRPKASRNRRAATRLSSRRQVLRPTRPAPVSRECSKPEVKGPVPGSRRRRRSRSLPHSTGRRSNRTPRLRQHRPIKRAQFRTRLVRGRGTIGRRPPILNPLPRRARHRRLLPGHLARQCYGGLRLRIVATTDRIRLRPAMIRTVRPEVGEAPRRYCTDPMNPRTRIVRFRPPDRPMAGRRPRVNRTAGIRNKS